MGNNILKNVEELVDGFKSYATVIKDQANSILESISGGRSPEKKDLDSFNLNINKLQEKYDIINGIAKEYLSIEENPGEGASILDLASAIKNSHQRLIEEEISKANNILNQFILVRATLEKYTVALQPFQKEAESLLNEIKNGKTSSILDSATYEGSVHFIEAITAKSVDEEKEEKLLESIEKYYNDTVALGVSRQKYYISENSNMNEAEPTDSFDESTSSDNVPGVTRDESVGNSASNQSDADTNNNTNVSEKNNKNNEKEVIAPADVEVKESAAPEADKEPVTWENLGISVPEELTVSIDNSLLTVNEFKKDKEFSASKLISDLKKSTDGALLSVILRLTDEYHGITVNYLKWFIEDNENIPYGESAVVLACEKLVNLGYLKKHSIAGYEDYYSFTKNGRKIFSTKKSADHLKIAPHKVSDDTRETSNSVLSKVIRLQLNNIVRNDTSKASSTTLGSDEDCFCQIWDDAFGKDKSLVASGIISDRPEQFKLLKDEVVKHIQKDTTLVVSSISKEKAKAITKWIVEELESNCSPILTLYADKTSGDLFSFKDDTPIKSILDYYNKDQTDSHKTNKFNTSNNNEKTTDSIIEDDENSNRTENDSGEKTLDLKDEQSNGLLTDTPTIISTSESDTTIEVEDNCLIDQTTEYLNSIIDSPNKPTDQEFLELTNDIISGKVKSKGRISDVVRATLFAKTASFYESNTNSKILYNNLLAATRMPIDYFNYSSLSIANILECDDESLIISAYMQAMLLPANEYDYGLRQQTEAFLKNYEDHFPNLGLIKPLFSKLKRIEDIMPYGFTSSALAMLNGKVETKKYLDALSKKAKDLKQIPQIKIKIKNLPKLFNKCFGDGSDIFICLDIIENGKTDDADIVGAVLDEYCFIQAESKTLDKEKIEQKIDKEWEEVSGKDFKLTYTARQQISRYFNNRLDLLKAWYDHIINTNDSKIDIKRVTALKNEIIDISSEILEKIDLIKVKNVGIIEWTLNYLIKYLRGELDKASIFSEFAVTGIFSLDNEGVPIIDESMAEIMFYSPWKNILRHINSNIETLDEAHDQIYLYSEIFDNLNQLKWIGYFKSEEVSISESQLSEAKNNADYNCTKFKEDLELAYTYNRIVESDKERLQTIMEYYKEFFYEIKDFGCWKQFLDSLGKEIDYLTSKNKVTLRNYLDARKAKLSFGETSTILEDAEMLLEEKQNFAVTEEYLNRFDNGERDFSEELSAVLNEKDCFADFISDVIFNPMCDFCEQRSGKALRNYGWSFVNSRLPAGWTSRQKENSQELIGNWPLRKDATTTENILKLLTRLGFSVDKVEKSKASSICDGFKAYLNPTPKSMSDYRHPISKFGTKMINPLNVVVFFGKLGPKELVNRVCDLDFGEIALVLIDRPIDRASRREISEIFHNETTQQNPFIFIDQVLLLYLATYQETERLSVLLKCSLPYTTYQPFVYDGGSTTDEMFFGRTKELSTILDPNGACIVYGGRQLGKTALLQRAEGRFHNSKEKKYAVYCDVRPCSTEESLIKKIIEEINIKTDLDVNENIDSIDGLRKNLLKKFKNGKIEQMLLLIDESDNFLAGIADQNYDPLQGFVNLKRETTNSFKFVLAGLHNVCRAKNATSDNGVFGQMGTPLCIKPLYPTEALQLLSRPLRYLGFEIDRYPHLETILTNTNYYPGILQFFGYKLVEAFTTEYGKYYHAADGQPPFQLKDEQLGAVMNSADLNSSIKEKFRLSLKLDQRYYMLARCITMLYHYRNVTDGSWLEYSVDEIKEMADTYELYCLSKLGVTEYHILLDEMVEMGILSKSESGLYRLRRNSFVDIIGADMDELDREIIENNVEAI